jgi:tetratricopeptide (TPR) repeat protein
MVTSVEARQTRLLGGRRHAWPLLAALCAAGLAWGGWSWWVEHRYKAAMAGIESSIMGGHYALACRDLESLLSWKADPNGGIVYLLGSCELARGRNQAASEAWARVQPGTAFWERAIRGRMRIFQNAGQFAAAERLIFDAAQDRRTDRTGMLVLLVPLLSELGRQDEALRIVEQRWEHLNAQGEGALEPAIRLLLQHIELSLQALPVETIRVALDRAGQLAPDDDRVWLGRADLALRTGAFDDAGRWLDACLERRPEDSAVWRSRLNWGIAANRIDVVEEARKRLPDAESTIANSHRAAAWLAWKRGDLGTERLELRRLVAADSTDPKAADRLAELASRAGNLGEAAELERHRTKMAGLLHGYRRLHERKQPIRDAVKMAKLAQQLGREFEARGFLTIALAENPSREDLRLALRQLTLAKPP